MRARVAPILDAEFTLAPIKSLADIKLVNVTFDFETPDKEIDALFKTFGGIFAFTITPHNASVAFEDNTTYINEPIELRKNEEYHAECGVKSDYLYNYLILYARIWQDEETAHEKAT